MSDLREVARQLADKASDDCRQAQIDLAYPLPTMKLMIRQAILEGMKAALGPADEEMVRAIMDSGKNANTSWSSAIHDTWNAMAEVRRKSLDADETVRRGK